MKAARFSEPGLNKDGVLVRGFRFYWLNWAIGHPVQAGMALALVVILVASVVPLLFTLLPGRKVPLRYNLRNLQVRWKTTLVTALAFTLVTGLLCIMLAFVKGMERLTEGSGHPGNVLVLSDGATDEVFSNLPKFSIELLPRDVQAHAQRSADGKNYLASQEVYVIVSHMIPNPTPGGRKRRFVQMRGLDNMPVAAEVHEIALAHGTWPSPSGVHAFGDSTDTAPECVLGDGIARTLGSDVGKPSLLPGDVLEMGPRRWYVTGIMKPNGSTFASEVWTRDTFVQELFGRKNSYSAYVVRTANATVAKMASEALKNFRSERNLQAQPEREYYSKLSQTNQQFSVAIYFVAIVMALGGMLGIMNTMFAAISQRTKDIGVLRLMGYRRWQVLVSFQAESLLIALLGGVLGCGLGYLFDGMTATSIISSGAGGGKSIVLKLVVDSGVMLRAMLFAVLMGAIGGILPSIHGMRLRPLESLK